MNKIKQMLTSMKQLLTPKFLGFALLAILIFFIMFYWFSKKTKETVKEHQFLIASDNRFVPLDLHGQEQYMQGFVTELLESIAKDEEIKLHVISVGTQQLFDSLNKSYYDGVISSLPPSVISEKKYLFSDPLYVLGPVLVVPLNSTAKKISDLQIVGIKTGVSATFALSQAPYTSIIPYENMNLALSELVAGKIDGLILDSLDAYAYIQGFYADRLKVVTAPLTTDGLRLITLHNFFGKQLIKIFNQGLKKAKKDKVYEKLLKKWDLVDPESLQD